MRLALVLAALIALVAALYFALSTDPASPALEPTPVAPAVGPLPELEPLLPPTLGERSATLEVDAPESLPSAPRPTGAAANIAILLLGDSGPVDGGAVELRDALGRNLALSGGEREPRRAAGLAPGAYTLTASAFGHVGVIRQLTVQAVPEEQRFEIRMSRAPFVRVRWQTGDGRAFLDALRAPGLFADAVAVCVALDDVSRPVGSSAPQLAREFWGTLLRPQAGSEPFRPGTPWAGAPWDAVCGLTRADPSLAFLTASVDGTVVSSVAIPDGAAEVLVQTPVDFVRGLPATLRFCLVDAESGQPIADARFAAIKSRRIVRPAIDVGQTGCRIDSRCTAGRWLLSFEANGYAPLRREFELGSATDLDLGTLRLERPRALVVHAALPDGSPAAAVQVSVGPTARFGEERTVLTTDAKGVARISSLSAEPHVLLVTDPRYASPALVVQPHPRGQREIVAIRVDPGVEIALDFGPQVASASRVYLHDAAGNPMGVRWLPPAGLVPLRLLPGEYVVELEGASSARAFTVTNESVVFDLR